MLLIFYIVLYFPVYFASRHFIKFSMDLTNAGIHALIACVATFIIVVALVPLKDRLWK